MESNNLFSIIMPAFNAEKTIGASIDSVLHQTDQEFELIIVDDASSDNTLRIINSYKDSRIKLIINNENSGVALSRNRAIEIATGKYIAFLDSDDIWLPEKLEKQREVFNEGISVVCSAYKTIDEEGNVNNKCIFFKEKISYHDMLKSNFIPNLTAAYDSHLLGKFYQKKIGHEDYVMWLEVLKKGQLARCIPECLAYYRVTNKSLSSNKLKAMHWQFMIYREYLNMNIFKSIYYFIFYALNAIKKRT